MQTGTFVSPSRSKLGPDPEPQHRIRSIRADGRKSVATCSCGWNRKRATPWIARQALLAHIEAS